MSRAQSTEAFKQAKAQSAQDQGNAQQSLIKTNNALGDYTTNLGNFMDKAGATYGPNGEFARTMNTLSTTAAGAGARNLGQQLALRSMRTGENTAGYAPAAAEAGRQASRDLTDTLAQQNATRMDKLTQLQGYQVDASKFPATVQASLYGPSLGGANAALGNEAKAAEPPSFWDTFGTAYAAAQGKALGSPPSPTSGE